LRAIRNTAMSVPTNTNAPMTWALCVFSQLIAMASSATSFVSAVRAAVAMPTLSAFA
jgi:hypothetical protein